MRHLSLLLLAACSSPDPDPTDPDPGTNVGMPTGTEGGTPTGTPSGTLSGTPTGGTPSGSTTTPTNQAWSLDWSQGNFVQPAGVGSLVAGLFGEPFLLGVIATGPGVLDLRLADGTAFGAQDLCVPTSDALGVDHSAAPDFAADFGRTLSNDAGARVAIEDTVVTGRLDPAAGILVDVRITGLLDTAPLTSLVGSNPCALLATFGVVCVPCASGSVDCVVSEIDQVPVTPFVDPLVERTLADVQADPACP